MKVENKRRILLKTEKLSKHFPRKTAPFKTQVVKAVTEVSLDAFEGETVAIVGESGAGKTTFGKTAIRIYNPTQGRIWFDGEEITSINGEALRKYRKNMQMVFQDPGSSLNPRRKIRDIVSQPLKIYEGASKPVCTRRTIKLLEIVELPNTSMHSYPRSLSGGQKQRVGIGRALCLSPRLIVLDEPTAALDVSVQAKILQLLERLQQELTLTYLYITHDLSVVRNISNRTAVMYLGTVVEIAETAELFENPLHPYTKALISAIPVISDDELKRIPEEITLEGEIPSPSNVPAHCKFFSRCQNRMDICQEGDPELANITDNHLVRCYLYQ